MLITSSDKLWSAQEYFEWESEQPIKYELRNGEVFAMAGASRQHNIIDNNIGGVLRNCLRERDCEIYQGEMRQEVKAELAYYYPDIIVVCGEPRFRPDTNPETLLNPTLVFEILSPSTELYDRNQKLHQYMAMDSVQGCFLVAQHMPRVEAYTRRDDGWHFRLLSGLDETLEIEAPARDLPLSEIYLKVRFDSPLSS